MEITTYVTHVFLPLLTLTFPPLQQAIESAPLSWAFCENCLSVRAFQRRRVFSQHDNGADLMGTLFFRA